MSVLRLAEHAPIFVKSSKVLRCEMKSRSRRSDDEFRRSIVFLVTRLLRKCRTNDNPVDKRYVLIKCVY